MADDFFISPQTGRRVLEQDKVWIGSDKHIEIPHVRDASLILLGEGNIIVGNKDNIGEESVALKDLTSRVLELRRELSTIEQNATFIIKTDIPLLHNAQALDRLPDGVLKHENGIITTFQASQIAPNDATYIIQTENNNLPNAQALNTLGTGILKTNNSGVISIASGGATVSIDDYVRPADLLLEQEARIAADDSLSASITAEETARIRADTAIETSITALTTEIETEIAALAGVEAITTLGTILGFIGITAGGKAYGEYIKGQTLNVKNKWTSSDLNDEGHNAIGDFEFRYPSGYSSNDRGHGTLWFDSDGRSSSHQSEPGLRIFSWDSDADRFGFDSPIAPIHIGIFGYQNKYHTSPIPNPTPQYKGFIFRSEFHNESSSDDYYRFPKNFGLYDVKRTISTLTHQSWGWDHKNTIFEYDYTAFAFHTPVTFQDSITAEDVSIAKSLTIPVGTEQERPSTPKVGMTRLLEINGEKKLEVYNGDDWFVVSLQLLGTTNQIDIQEDATKTLTLKIAENPVLPGTGAVTIPIGTTAERPASPTIGMLRFNTDAGNVDNLTSYINAAQTQGVLLAMYVADDQYILTSGNDVTEWLDVSGNNNNATKYAPKSFPQYSSGQGFIDFTSAASALQIAKDISPSHLAEIMIFAKIEIVSYQSTSTMGGIIASDNGGFDRGLYVKTDGFTFIGAGYGFEPIAATSLNTTHVIGSTFSNTQSNISCLDNVNFAEPGYSNSDNLTHLYIGGSPQYNEYANVKVKEVRLYVNFPTSESQFNVIRDHMINGWQ